MPLIDLRLDERINQVSCIFCFSGREIMILPAIQLYDLDIFSNLFTNMMLMFIQLKCCLFNSYSKPTQRDKICHITENGQYSRLK